MNHCGPLPLRELHSTVKQWCGETLVDLEPVYHLTLWVKSHCHLLPHLQQAVEKERRVLSNTEKKKLVLGFLHSINHTVSPQDESYIHSHFIPGQNNKSSKCKLERRRKKRGKKAAHNPRHNTINSKHNRHRYLHFTYLRLGKVQTGMFSFADLLIFSVHN